MSRKLRGAIPASLTASRKRKNPVVLFITRGSVGGLLQCIVRIVGSMCARTATYIRAKASIFEYNHYGAKGMLKACLAKFMQLSQRILCFGTGSRAFNLLP